MLSSGGNIEGVAHRWSRSIAKLLWVFVGYTTAMVAVSAAAYLTDEGGTLLYAWIMVAGSVPMALALAISGSLLD